MMKKPDTATLAGRHLRALAAGALAHRRADAALSSLVRLVKPGAVVILKGGRKFRLIDQFANGNIVAFRPVDIRRYKLEEISEP